MGACNCVSKQEQDKVNELQTNLSPSHPENYQSSAQQIILRQESNQNQRSHQQSPQQQQVDSFTSMTDLKRAEKKKKVKIEALSQELILLENVTRIEKKKSPFDFQLILNALQDHFLFAQLLQDDKEKIIDKMFYVTVKDGEFVFQQGDKASLYFIIERGQCQIVINDDVKKTLKSSEPFGELALLYGAPRSASVRALGDCGFWAIDRNTFKKAVEEIQSNEYEENRKFIQKVKFFDFMTEEQKDAIANVLITLVFKKGENIVNDGDMANSFYIIKSGQVSILKGQKELRKMNPGDSFGEQALFENCTRGATVKAIEEQVKCMSLGREELTKILGEQVQYVIYNNIQKWAFEKHQILQKLTKIQIEKIVQNIKSSDYEENQIIFKENQNVSKLVIVLEGHLIKFQSQDNSIIEKGQLFGDEYLYKNKRQDRLTQNIICKGKCLLAELSFSEFFEAIGGDLETIMKKNEDSIEKKLKTKSNRKDYSHLKLESLIGIKKLGQGQFGSVYLVKGSDQQYYALKCIQKFEIVEQNLERHLEQERNVLLALDSQFIMNFYRSFKDRNYIYFLNEYIKGMELFDVIREIGLLNSSQTQFYVGSILKCIEYLHSQKIIYRDVKPENIMIDAKGYVKLIDMGTAKFLNSKKTHTIIGTPHYMAPEIIIGKGYTFSADMWSIGVCFYEFMCGTVPYAEDAEDPVEIYDEIMRTNLTFPSFLKDVKAKKLMNKLMNKTQELRGQSEQIQADKFFEGDFFDCLIAHELKAPYIPPKDKLTSDAEIKKLESKLVSYQDNLNQQETKDEQQYNPNQAKDQDWDKDF